MKDYLKYAVEFEKYVYIWSRAMTQANDRKRQIYSDYQNIKKLQTSNGNRLSGLNLSFETQRRMKERDIDLYKKKANTATGVLAVSLVFMILLYIFLDFYYFIVLSVFGVFVVLPICLGVIIHNKVKIAQLKKEVDGLMQSDSGRRQEIIMQARENQYEDKLNENRNEEALISKQQQDIQSSLLIAQKNLRQIYDVNVLPAKYRNLTAVATLYEYLETGRCNTITGHGGIYDTYETERIHLAQLQQMVEMNQRLSRIEDNQRYICQEMQKANSTLRSINSSLKEIEKTNAEISRNTAISAVANQQTAAATKWMAWNAWAQGY